MNLKDFLLFMYVDPGSGSTAFQFAIAGFVGIAWTIRCYFAQIKSFFSKKNSSGKNPGKRSIP